MKTPKCFLATLLGAGLIVGLMGCAQQPVIGGSHVSSLSRSPRTFALSVTLPDGTPVSPQQWANVKESFRQQLEAAGCTLTDDISLAERIIRVVFSPSFEDPNNGTSTVLSVRSNPAYAFNAPTTLMPAFAGYGYPTGFYSFGFDDTYIDRSTVTPHVDPHVHHRPTRPDDCPPNSNHDSNHNNSDHSDHHWNGNGGQFADNDHNDHHRWGPTNDNSGGSNNSSSGTNTSHWSRSTDSNNSNGSHSGWSRSDSSNSNNSHSGWSHSSDSGSSRSSDSGGGWSHSSSSDSGSSSYSSGSSSFSSGSSSGSSFSSPSSGSASQSSTVSSSAGQKDLN